MKWAESEGGAIIMKILPSYEEIQRITADGTYKICPVSCEMLSDICTPIEALKILKIYPPTAICWNR